MNVPHSIAHIPYLFVQKMEYNHGGDDEADSSILVRQLDYARCAQLY